MTKCFQYLARVLSWSGIAAILAVALPVTELTAEVDLSTILEFKDVREPNAEYSDQGKAWSVVEREKVLEYFEFISEEAPGLLQRVTAFRPIQLYRPQKVIYVGGSTFNDQIDNAILLPDSYFEDEARTGQHGLIHELAHLADMGNKVAHSPEWSALVGSKIEGIRASLRKEGLGHHQAAGKRLETELALKEGFPSGYAASSIYEALAECVTFTILPG
ncbi:MAG: hypothetical protein ACI9S8_001638 [Chlamydiales bacterium]|jgi:hypothetical protein